MFPSLVVFLVLTVKVTSSSTENPNPISRFDPGILSLFEKWLVEHNKVYNALGETQKRFNIFKDNLKFIDEHNAKNKSYSLGLNQFADLTVHEFSSMYLNAFICETPFKVETEVTFKPQRLDAPLPAAVNWTAAGAVTPVKSQERCACCWIFSAVASVESLNKIVKGKLNSLSEQEVLDCEERQRGCKGGYMEWAYNFIVNNSGITDEADYPYIGAKGNCDRTKLNHRFGSIDGYRKLKSKESVLQAAVARQPVSTGLGVDPQSFRFYKRGVYKEGGRTHLNHAVLVVGYGNEEGDDYWLIKNSFGTKWGEEGYFKLQRNVPEPYGKCAITKYAVYPYSTASFHHSY